MPISSYQCRAARGLFAMSRQELADASGVSVRTISSFEDSGDRVPTLANLAAIEAGFKKLGVLFTSAGVEWVPAFPEAQMKVIRALQVRTGPTMCQPSDLYAETGCSRGDLEALQKLRIIEGIDTLPTLTAIGLHIPQLLREYEARQEARKRLVDPINYTVILEERTIFHAQTAATFRIQDDGSLSVVFEHLVPADERGALLAGAREALRLHRERDPRMVGHFVWGRN